MHLSLQQKAKKSHTIPKQHRPHPLYTATPDAFKEKETFNQQYETLFFEHLDRVILQNTIAIEIKKAKIQNILQTTEQALAESQDDPEIIQRQYKTFLLTNNITNHEMNPELQKKLQLITTETTEHRDKTALKSTNSTSNKRKHSKPHPPAQKQSKTHHFLSTGHNPKNLTHNYSSLPLTTADSELLSKGLSFTPTPKLETPHAFFELLHQFDHYATSIRSIYNQQLKTRNLKLPDTHPPSDSNTAYVFRRMKFLKNKPALPSEPQYSCNNQHIENYIHSTKLNISTNLDGMYNSPQKANLTKQQQNTIKKLQKSRNSITIKPADKNLGIVVLDTEDYLKECVEHLSDVNTYRQTQSFPANAITKTLTNTIISFKTSLTSYNEKLYKYLQPTNSHRTPKFYGIPKIHKQFKDIPPIRPIISHSNSLLSHTAQFIDHILQPLAQSYPDYLQNSTALIQALDSVTIPKDAILVTVDVVNLYPSIPQTECLQIVYDEMYKHRDLLIFDPNLIIRLLHININFNYFEFINIIFQQIQGTAMGAAFSPTIANIFMSIFLQRFLQTQKNKPLLLRRYIDDIFLIWPKQHNLTTFINELNSFHPNLQFTYSNSETSADFLDITIYKGDHWNNSSTLEIKTFQKSQNLYQYLHYSSHHPKTTNKGIIIGECIRYIRTNTSKRNYETQLELFKYRLLKRGYPLSIINTYTNKMQYSQRPQLLQSKQQSTKPIMKPIFKCLPPPQYTQLKQIIFKDFHLIRKYMKKPLLIQLCYPTLHKLLIRAQYNPTSEQLVDAILRLSDNQQANEHISTGQLPILKNANNRIKKCNHPRCITCKHLNNNPSFTSTANKTTYKIRHSFTCSSQNVVYLITCSKCKKQYVGMTTKSLRERINHHRTSIRSDTNRYLNNHFNLPDHDITNLKVQPIDTITCKIHTFAELHKLEKFWIHTLVTYIPHGLNATK